MANTLLTIDMITRKALQILENELSITRNVNRQYDDAFAETGAKIGSTLRIRLPDRVLVSKGPALQVQDQTEQWTTLTVATQAQVALNFTTAELTMQMDDFATRILKPRVSQLAATIDADVASVYNQIGNSVGTPGTPPATSLVLLQAMQKQSEMGTPLSERYASVNPVANANLVEGMKGLFNPVSTIAKQFKGGLMGEGILGLEEINMTQSIRQFTTGSRAPTGATITTTVTAQGTTTLAITGTGSQVINAGDVFTIAGSNAVNPQTRESTGSLQQFVCLATNTASAGAYTGVSIYPPLFDNTQAYATVDVLPQSGAAVTFIGNASTTYPQNLIYHKNAITFATADLIMPNGVDMAAREVHNGISMRIIRDYDINNDRMPCRMDVLYGYAALRPPMAVRLWG
jgi:hypothetical protein